MIPLLGRRGAATVGAFVVSGLAFVLATQFPNTLRFDIGSWDRAWLVDSAQFYPSKTMTGPWRHEDGSVEVIEFRARQTRRQATLALPYHALDTPLELNIRCHRFGLRGAAIITVGESFRDEAEFSDRSYPWAGVRLTIPEETAAEGPLRVGFEIVGGDPPPGFMPDDMGLGIDWIEVRPLSEDAWFLPAAREWLSLFLVLLLGAAVAVQMGLGPLAQGAMVLTLGCAVALLAAVYPVMTLGLLPYAWLAFPLIMYVVWIARLAAQHPLPGRPPEVRCGDRT